MRIDGKEIAHSIFDQLVKRVEKLKEKNIVPHTAIILVGNDPASLAYVSQKEKKAESIGAKTTIYNLPLTVNQEGLLTTIEQLNNDSNIHGIIVQRPLPKHIDNNAINLATNPAKDIDAFCPNTEFSMPLSQAVLRIIEEVFYSSSNPALSENREVSSRLRSNNIVFTNWLKSKRILVIGKGETGGGPVIALLQKMNIEPLVIDSKTKNPQVFTKQADIIVSTVGREKLLTLNMLKKDVILIGVGMYKGKDQKLHADYEEDEIKDIASFYTPVPGGVGPVNVAMLLENLVIAAENFGY